MSNAERSPQNGEEEIKYTTRIAEHIRLASAARMLSGGEQVTIREVSEETNTPYQTVRSNMRAEIANPNYAVIDKIRRYLNQFNRVPLAGYITRVGQEEELGAWGAVSVRGSP